MADGGGMAMTFVSKNGVGAGIVLVSSLNGLIVLNMENFLCYFCTTSNY